MSSLLSRLARPPQPVGRAYSSFFSSKPGGGRHFVSAKPPKPVLQPGRAKVDNTTAAGSSPESSASSPPANASSAVKIATADEKPSSKPTEAHPRSSPALPLPSSTPPPFTYSSSYSGRVSESFHPTVSSGEYKLHQFFSLHRPLLLLNQPTSAIFEVADPSLPLFPSSEDQAGDDSQASFATIDSPPEASPDADADAARQLAHTLVMNRVGGTITWQQTLSRLGLGAGCSGSDMALAKETAQEWVTIHADSTRRKKRKKMKKHKLKKRRRLTRRQSK